jgi:hypothetical protein
MSKKKAKAAKKPAKAGKKPAKAQKKKEGWFSKHFTEH